MQRWAATGLMFLGLATSVAAQGIAARNLAESLTGLHGVMVIVEDLPPVAVAAGLNTAALQSSIEAKLIGRGVPILGLGELAMDPRGPTLLVRVDMDLSDPVYFYNAEVQFFQNVDLMVGEEALMSSASASTWQASQFARIGKFRINTLPQEINKMIDAFATDYLESSEAMPVIEHPDADEENEGGVEGEGANPDSLVQNGG